MSFLTDPASLITVIILLVIGIIFTNFKATKRVYLAGRREKRAADDRAEMVTFLNRFVNSITTSSNPKKWMGEIAGSIAGALDAGAVRIFMIEGDQQLRAIASTGQLPAAENGDEYQFRKGHRLLEDLQRDAIEIGDGLIGEVALSGRSELLERVTEKTGTAAGRNGAASVQSLVVVPLILNEQIIGVVCAVNKRTPGTYFSTEDLFVLSSLSNQVTLGMTLIQAYGELGEKHRIQQELLLAQEIQKSLLPHTTPAVRQFSIHAINRAAREVSGDYYDFVEIDDDLILVVIADASGKGIPACMLMAMCRSFVHANARRYKNDLGGLLKALNGNLFDDTDGSKFITMALCLIDKRDNTVEYLRAGHTELLMRMPDGEVQVIQPDGPALGVLPVDHDIEFDSFYFSWLPEMSLLLFTDGITEALDDNDEEYGLDRLINVWKAANHDPEATTGHVLKSVQDFTKSQPQTDDQTLVVLSRTC